MRVVLDTNVWISAVVYGGHPQEIVQAATAGMIDVFVSEALMEELQAVLRRPQFGLRLQFVQNTIAELGALVHWVVPEKHHQLVDEDPSDNVVIDCAVSAEADYIVTGDKHLLRLGKCGATHIVTPEAFTNSLSR